MRPEKQKFVICWLVYFCLYVASVTSTGVEVLLPEKQHILTGSFEFTTNFTNITGELILADPINACKMPLANTEEIKDKIVLVNGTLLITI
jgi:hypothetical protein